PLPVWRVGRPPREHLLERNVPAELGVLGEVNLAHAPLCVEADRPESGSGAGRGPPAVGVWGESLPVHLRPGAGGRGGGGPPREGGRGLDREAATGGSLGRARLILPRRGRSRRGGVGPPRTAARHWRAATRRQ